MPYDFDKKMGKDKMLMMLKKKIRSGSIIVLHDTIGSAALSILNDFIDYAANGGYKFVTPSFSSKK